MAKPALKIAVTGGAGQIAYSLLFRIAHGDVFGPDQPIALHILEIPAALAALEGVKMELEDCAFPLLKEIRIGSDPFELFKDIHLALLIGAAPRGPGMERSELLNLNAKIFVEQGKALNAVADLGVKVFVVGNPCNTNCLIAMNNAPRIPKHQFHSMMRLDQNRAAFQLANKAQVDVMDVSELVVWGNHSSTQLPDYFHAKIKGRPALEVIHDHSWLENEFILTVQKRGAAIINARGKSSAASAANALVDSIKDVIKQSEDETWFSSGVWSEGNSYGIAEDLVFSFPCIVKKTGGRWQFVPELEMNDFLLKGLKATEKELLEERDLVREMLT